MKSKVKQRSRESFFSHFFENTALLWPFGLWGQSLGASGWGSSGPRGGEFASRGFRHCEYSRGRGEVGEEKGKCQEGGRIVTFQVCATHENPWVAFDHFFPQWGHQIVNSTLS